MNEQNKYDVVKTLADHNGNKQRAALKLGITVRHLNRLINGYNKYGKEFFVHGNRGRKPANTISNNVRVSVIDLYRTKYFDANFAHFTELLCNHENISLSASAVASILESADIYSPRITRSKKKRIREELKQKQNLSSSQKEIRQIQANLVALQDAHSRRPKCAYFGELQQMDASPHLWLRNIVTSLHIAVDNATGHQVHYTKGMKSMVVRAFDETLYCCVNDKDVYSLEEIPEHETKSKNLDFDYKKPELKKIHIPPMSHPWKSASFKAFLRKQKHHENDEYKQSV